MTISNYSLQNIIDRIYVVLPTKFSRDVSTQLYSLIYGIGSAFKISSEQIDELVTQTNLVSATGAYVDDYIGDLTQIGRRQSLLTGLNETDDEYKQRFYKNVFSYNCTKTGLQMVVHDLMGVNPYAMYTSSKRGSYLNGRNYFNDAPFTSLYGDNNSAAYVAYIEFSRKPNDYIIEDICKTVAACKAAGVRIYLKYPVGNPLELSSFTTGTYERTILV